LAETNPVTGGLLGNYALASGSPAINYIPPTSLAGMLAPTTDFFGNARPSGSAIDVGAVEFQGTNTPLPFVSPDSLNFGNVLESGTSATQTLTLTNPAGQPQLTGITLTFNPVGPFTRSGGTCTATLNAGASCTITVVFHAPATAGTVNATLALAASRTIGGSPVSLTGNSVPAPTLTSISPSALIRGSTVSVTLTGTNFSDLGSSVTIVTGTGVTVSNVTEVSSTMITATFTVSASATAGTLRVTTGGLNTNTVAFTAVNPPAPTLASISPNTHARGGGLFQVTLTGTNFVTGATVGVALVGPGNNGVTASGVTVVNSTTITANFNVSNTAAHAARNVTVHTTGGTSNAVTFTVP